MDYKSLKPILKTKKNPQVKDPIRYPNVINGFENQSKRDFSKSLESESWPINNTTSCLYGILHWVPSYFLIRIFPIFTAPGDKNIDCGPIRGFNTKSGASLGAPLASQIVP